MSKNDYYEKNKERTEYMKAYYEKNKQKKREYDKQRRLEQKEKISMQVKQYSETNKEKIKEYKKQWYSTNKKIIYEKNRIRKAQDPLYRLSCNIRSLIKKAINAKGYCKNTKTYEILGCGYAELKEHIESQWEPWMNWDNYGLYNGELNHGWDIDHIVPCSTGINEQEIKNLNHYTNLQPLCSKVNRDIKRDRVYS